VIGAGSELGWDFFGFLNTFLVSAQIVEEVSDFEFTDMLLPLFLSKVL